DGAIRLWDPATGKEVARLTGHSKEVLAVAFSPDGRRLLSAGMGGTARLWDVNARIQLRSINHPGNVRRVVFSSDGRHAVTCCAAGAAGVGDLESGKEYRRFQGQGMPTGCAILADRSGVLSSSVDHTIRFWDVLTGKIRHHLTGHGHAVWGLAVSP